MHNWNGNMKYLLGFFKKHLSLMEIEKRLLGRILISKDEWINQILRDSS